MNTEILSPHPLRYTLLMKLRDLQPISRARWILVGIFLAERAILYAAGLRCQLESLSWYWQILDPAVLKDHLAGSLLHLHAQPPLFNLMTGILLKLGGGLWLFSLFCTLNGVLMLLVLFEILSDFGWSHRYKLLLLSLLPLLPAWIVYEQWYFYDFPTALLLALASLTLLRWGKKGEAGNLLLYLGALTALAGLRSIFHFLWLLPAIALVPLARRPDSRRLRAALLLPLLLLGGLYLKNFTLFGFFGSSSWMGLSLVKMTTSRLPRAETRKLVRDGVLSSLALVRPFAPIEEYEQVSGERFINPADPVLGTRERSPGHPNYNHLAYVGISATCRKDALKLIHRRPEIYLEAYGKAIRRFFSPVSAYPAFLSNLVLLAPIAKLELFGWDSPPVSAAIFLISFCWMLYAGIAAFRRRDRALTALYTFAVFTVIWVFITGNMLEVGENERFRFMLFPLLFLAIAGIPEFTRRPRKSTLPERQGHPGASAPPAKVGSE